MNLSKIFANDVDAADCTFDLFEPIFSFRSSAIAPFGCDPGQQETLTSQETSLLRQAA